MRYRDMNDWIERSAWTVNNTYHLYRCVKREFSGGRFRGHWNVEMSGDSVILTRLDDYDYAILEFDGSGVSMECYFGDTGEQYNSDYVDSNYDESIINMIHISF